MEKQRDFSGVFFKNDRKSRYTDADYNGSATINGAEYWLNGWVKVSKAGNKCLSLSLKPKQEPRSTKSLKEDLDNEIPF